MEANRCNIEANSLMLLEVINVILAWWKWFIQSHAIPKQSIWEMENYKDKTDRYNPLVISVCLCCPSPCCKLVKGWYEKGSKSETRSKRLTIGFFLSLLMSLSDAYFPIISSWFILAPLAWEIPVLVVIEWKNTVRALYWEARLLGELRGHRGTPIQSKGVLSLSFGQV